MALLKIVGFCVIILFCELQQTVRGDSSNNGIAKGNRGSSRKDEQKGILAFDAESNGWHWVNIRIPSSSSQIDEQEATTSTEHPSTNQEAQYSVGTSHSGIRKQIKVYNTETSSWEYVNVHV